MPIHDWSRVFDEAFHDFHLAWIAELRNTLNGGLLPPDYYAMAEQVARPTVPDVLTLQTTNGFSGEWSGEPISGATAVAIAPPRVRDRESIEQEIYARRQKSIVIHHVSDDRIVALIEILSSSDKSSKQEFRTFVTKVLNALEYGHHLLLIDLQPPTPRDPNGIRPVIWDEIGGKPKPAPSEQPLSLVAYDAGPPTTAYVEPAGVGDALIDMPLFLAPGWYVNVPLEASYEGAWRGVPRRFREILETPGVKRES